MKEKHLLYLLAAIAVVDLWINYQLYNQSKLLEVKTNG